MSDDVTNSERQVCLCGRCESAFRKKWFVRKINGPDRITAQCENCLTMQPCNLFMIAKKPAKPTSAERAISTVRTSETYKTDRRE